MSTEVACFWSPTSEVADLEKEDISLESFDKDIEELFSDWHFPEVQGTFPNYPGTFPVISTPPSLAYSTESDSEWTPSQYSFAPSDYSTPSDIVAGGPAEHRFYSPHDSVYSDVIPNDPLSFGPLPPSPPLNPVRAHSEYGTSNPYQPLFEIPPEDRSFALPLSATVVPSTLDCVQDLQVMPDTQAYATPDRPFQCPLCPFGKAKSYQNLQLAHSSCYFSLEAQV
jgi:hypothetical protein